MLGPIIGMWIVFIRPNIALAQFVEYRLLINTGSFANEGRVATRMAASRIASMGVGRTFQTPRIVPAILAVGQSQDRPRRPPRRGDEPSRGLAQAVLPKILGFLRKGGDGHGGRHRRAASAGRRPIADTAMIIERGK
jgi:hypothetical protein